MIDDKKKNQFTLVDVIQNRNDVYGRRNIFICTELEIWTM